MKTVDVRKTESGKAELGKTYAYSELIFCGIILMGTVVTDSKCIA